MADRKADAIVAAYNAMEAAIRMLRPGQHKNMEITDVIQKVVTAYNCKPIENMLSHQLKRNKIGKGLSRFRCWLAQKACFRWREADNSEPRREAASRHGEVRDRAARSLRHRCAR